MTAARVTRTTDPTVLEHLRYLRQRGAADRSVLDRHECLSRLLAYLGGPALEATRADLDRWHGSLKLAPTSLASYTSHVRNFYVWAVQAGRLEASPADGLLRAPGSTSTRRTPRTDDPVVLDFLRHLRRRGLRDRTIVSRHEVLTRLLAYLGKPLLEATPNELDDWQELLSRSVCTSSVATFTSHARAFYTWAEDQDRIDRAPTYRMVQPRPPQRLPRPIPEGDLAQAIDEAEEPVRTWLILSAYAGLRAGEIARIRHEDVVVVNGETVLHVDGKGGKPRVIPLAGAVAAALREQMTASRRGEVFRQASGEPWRPQYLSRRVSVYFEELGMSYTLHQGRHRFGTEGYRASKDLLQLGRLMGHANPVTTSLYVALSDDSARGTMDAIALALEAPAAGEGPRRRLRSVAS